MEHAQPWRAGSLGRVWVRDELLAHTVELYEGRFRPGSRCDPGVGALLGLWKPPSLSKVAAGAGWVGDLS